MMIAMLVFLGVSSCATLAIVSAVILSARNQMPTEAAEAEEMVLAGSRASAKAALVPSYSH
jgi:hypothetical protein